VARRCPRFIVARVSPTPLLAPSPASGVPREVVANLEAGKSEPQTDLIEHIALALGRRLRDFAEE
jgi:hypothetical protein